MCLLILVKQTRTFAYWQSIENSLHTEYPLPAQLDLNFFLCGMSNEMLHLTTQESNQGSFKSLYLSYILNDLSQSNAVTTILQLGSKPFLQNHKGKICMKCSYLRSSRPVDLSKLIKIHDSYVKIQITSKHSNILTVPLEE